MLREDIDIGKAFANRIARDFDGRALHGGWRGQLAGAFQSVSLDHHVAIITLLEQGRPASALALARPQFESHLRGLWILHGATDADVDRFSERGHLPNTEELVRQVQHKSFCMRVMKDQAWRFLCDYTHTGLGQVSRNITSFGVEQDYPLEELRSLLRASNALALLAADEVAVLLADENLRRRNEAEAVAYLCREDG